MAAAASRLSLFPLALRLCCSQQYTSAPQNHVRAASLKQTLNRINPLPRLSRLCIGHPPAETSLLGAWPTTQSVTTVARAARAANILTASTSHSRSSGALNAAVVCASSVSEHSKDCRSVRHVRGHGTDAGGSESMGYCAHLTAQHLSPSVCLVTASISMCL